MAGTGFVTPGLLALADFRRLWLVGFVTYLVRWLEMLAFGLFAYEITNSAFIVALLSMLRLLPMGLFGAFLGVAADRFERRNALIVMVTVSLSCALVLVVLASLDAIKVWHLAVASFLNGICWAADNPVRRSMVGDVVGPDRMGRAMSVEIATSNLSRILGPMLSGVLLAQYGIAGVFCLAAALYAASLAAALRVGVRHAPAREHAMSFMASMREGLVWLRGDRRLIGVFLITIIFNIFGWPFLSMVPIIGTDYLHLGPKGVGLLASCEGVGGLIGAVLIGSLVRPAWQGRVYVGSVAIYFVTVIRLDGGPAVVPGRHIFGRFRGTANHAGLPLLTGGDACALSGFAVRVHRDWSYRLSLHWLPCRCADTPGRHGGACGPGHPGAADHATPVDAHAAPVVRRATNWSAHRAPSWRISGAVMTA